MSLLAISDDLTGAVALAAEAVRSHSDVRVLGPGGVGTARADGSLVVDTASRRCEPEDAARRVRATLEAGRGARRIVKRIDSVLRGQVEAELGAVRAVTGRPLVLAPAAPALGVSTVGGRQLVRGVPVSESGLWMDGEGARSDRLDEIAPGPVALLGLEDVRAGDVRRRLGELARTAATIVCDAESEDDLRRVREAAVDFPLGCSYGLLGAGLAPVRHRVDAARPTGILVLVGSRHAATVAQLTGAEVPLHDPRDADPALIAAHLRRDGVAGLIARAPRADGDAAAREIAAATLAVGAVTVPGAIVAVGGQTASLLFDRSGAEDLRVAAEPWPTVGTCRIGGGALDGVLLIAKSGAVGGPGWLAEALALLGRRSLRPDTDHAAAEATT